MNGCTATDKPQISILLAIYEPRIDWLREQLLSLNAQTYPNLKLYIRDDCSPSVPFSTIQSCVQDCIRAFSYELQQNENNVGSNKTFELLTHEADGEFFAYCDQDDVWLPEKLERLEQSISQTGALLAYCRQRVIDSTGALLAADISQVRRRDVFLDGSNIAPQLFVKNCIYGCTTLLRASVAKNALPLPEDFAYDHWFSLFAAANGSIFHHPDCLIDYRIHKNNQSSVFRKISTKQDYYTQRLCTLAKRSDACRTRFPQNPELTQHILAVSSWTASRMRWFARDLRAFPSFWQGRHLSPNAALFELFLPFCPHFLFQKIVRHL